MAGRERPFSVFALVTARGGSKGIPRKNVRSLCGKPLIAWTIGAALHSPSVDRTLVSTDDDEIASVAEAAGAEVPFRRPPELARDDSSHVEVVIHAAEWMQENWGLVPDYLLMLQPTSPLRNSNDITAAVELAESRQAHAVVGVTPAPSHPFLVKRLLEDGTMTDYVTGQPRYARRQDLPAAYALNGALYLNRLCSLRQERSFVPVGSLPYVMPFERSVDIDNELDWRIAEMLMEDLYGHRNS
jgi:CMP-N-acetylneuraminic acid synthetase